MHVLFDYVKNLLEKKTFLYEINIYFKIQVSQYRIEDPYFWEFPILRWFKEKRRS